MAKTKVLITVKTYPVISRTYQEVVCTAGMREDGSWIRIYPVPFRQYDEYEQYKKFQWIEADLVRNTSDKRSESYRLESEIKLLSWVGTENDWQERKNIVLNTGKVYSNLADVIARNKAGELSLATFKPTKIIKVTAEPTTREWDAELLDQITRQDSLFGEAAKPFTIARKLPFVFRYVFEDDAGKVSKLMIEDWEIGALFWNLIRTHGSEEIAVKKVIEQYESRLVRDRDIHFFLGTTLKWDARATNPFMIIGVFAPPMSYQNSLF